MKVFVDANVLVSVVNKEYPEFTYSSRVLSLAGTNRFDLYTSDLCLAIAFYFSSKKSGRAQAKKKISLICQNLRLAEITEKAVRSAVENPSVVDLEDGFQYYGALDAGCECIVTDDVNDFYFSEIAVLPSQRFLEAFVFDKRP